MLKRPAPPAHRADAPIMFVHGDDPAWDRDRVHKEQEALGELAKSHPVARYMGGWTRYDLDARGTLADGTITAPRDYIDDSKQPTLWKLRRLSWDQWYEIHPMVEKAWRNNERPYAAYLKACHYGVERVENGPTLELTAGRLSATDISTLHEWGQSNSIDLIFSLGEAVYQASMPLDKDGPEGKLSG